MAADVNHYLEQIPQYLDDSMSEIDRAAFEAAIDRHDVLRDTIAKHRSIDASLKKQFDPPAVEALMEWTGQIEPLNTDTSHSDQPALTTRSTLLRLRPLLTIAASLLITVAGLWLVASSTGLFDAEDAGPYGPQQTIAQAYASAVNTGFEPDWVCRDDAEFAATFEKEYRQPIVLDSIEGVQLLGLKYAHVFSGRTTGVLARVGEEPVVVFIDHHTRFGDDVDSDEAMKTYLAEFLPSDSDLQIFHKRLGELMLIECTPNAESAILPAFRIADRSGASQRGASE